MNFTDTVEAEHILQYYTIVDEETTPLVPIQQQLLMSNGEDVGEETGDWKSFVFVTVAPEQEDVGGSADLKIEDESNGSDSIGNGNPVLSNLKLITFEDGRMFVASDDSGKKMFIVVTLM